MPCDHPTSGEWKGLRPHLKSAKRELTNPKAAAAVFGSAENAGRFGTVLLVFAFTAVLGFTVAQLARFHGKAAVFPDPDVAPIDSNLVLPPTSVVTTAQGQVPVGAGT